MARQFLKAFKKWLVNCACAELLNELSIIDGLLLAIRRNRSLDIPRCNDLFVGIGGDRLHDWGFSNLWFEICLGRCLCPVTFLSTGKSLESSLRTYVSLPSVTSEVPAVICDTISVAVVPSKICWISMGRWSIVQVLQGH